MDLVLVAPRDGDACLPICKDLFPRKYQISCGKESRIALERPQRGLADSYGLFLGGRWYTEFVTGRSFSKRREFQGFLEDAQSDLYDVMLVDHTSRFGRNQ